MYHRSPLHVSEKFECTLNLVSRSSPQALKSLRSYVVACLRRRKIFGFQKKPLADAKKCEHLKGSKWVRTIHLKVYSIEKHLFDSKNVFLHEKTKTGGTLRQGSLFAILLAPAAPLDAFGVQILHFWAGGACGTVERFRRPNIAFSHRLRHR